MRPVPRQAGCLGRHVLFSALPKRQADYISDLLNAPAAQAFYRAFVFWAPKRPITADLLRPEGKDGGCGRLHAVLSSPVPVAEIVYFSSTSLVYGEVLKDSRSTWTSATQPAAKGTLQMFTARSGSPSRRPQVQITIKFLNSYGGMNPGAAEIMVFGPGTVAQAGRPPAATVRCGRSGRRRSSDPRLAPRSARLDAEDPRAALCDANRTRLAALGQRDDEEAAATGSLRSATCCCSTSTGCWSSSGTRSTPRTSTRITTRASANGGGLYVVRGPRPGRASRSNWSPRPTARSSTATSPTTARRSCSVGGAKQGEGYHLWTDRRRRHRPAAADRRRRGTTTTPAGCPTAASPSSARVTPQFAYCWHAPVGILHRMSADGSSVVRALGQLPERLHARRARRRTDHLHPLGIRRPAGDPHPEPVDDQPRRHGAGRLLRQPRAFARHVHGGPVDPRHARRSSAR